MGSSTLKSMPEPKRIQTRNSWIGNGFHLPSLVLVLWVLAAEGCSIRVPMQCVFEQHLRGNIAGSAFDDLVLKALPGNFGGQEFVNEVSSLFKNAQVPSKCYGTRPLNVLKAALFMFFARLKLSLYTIWVPSSLKIQHGRVNVTEHFYKLRLVFNGRLAIRARVWIIFSRQDYRKKSTSARPPKCHHLSLAS